MQKNKSQEKFGEIKSVQLCLDIIASGIGFILRLSADVCTPAEK